MRFAAIITCISLSAVLVLEVRPIYGNAGAGGEPIGPPVDTPYCDRYVYTDCGTRGTVHHQMQTPHHYRPPRYTPIPEPLLSATNGTEDRYSTFVRMLVDDAMVSLQNDNNTKNAVKFLNSAEQALMLPIIKKSLSIQLANMSINAAMDSLQYYNNTKNAVKFLNSAEQALMLPNVMAKTTTK